MPSPYPHPHISITESGLSRFFISAFDGSDSREQMGEWSAFVLEMALYQILEMIALEQIQVYRFIDEYRLMNGLTTDKLDEFHLVYGKNTIPSEQDIAQEILSIIDYIQTPQKKGGNLEEVIHLLVKDTLGSQHYRDPYKAFGIAWLTKAASQSNWCTLEELFPDNRALQHRLYRIRKEEESQKAMHKIAKDQVIYLNDLAYSDRVFISLKQELSDLILEQLERRRDRD